METAASNDCFICSVKSTFQETEAVRKVKHMLGNFKFKTPTANIH